MRRVSRLKKCLCLQYLQTLNITKLMLSSPICLAQGWDSLPNPRLGKDNLYSNIMAALLAQNIVLANLL